jgi:predicted permease
VGTVGVRNHARREIFTGRELTMNFIRQIQELWLRLFRRPGTEELDEEIREHLQIEIDEKLEVGMTPEDARYAAQRKFGNAVLYKELTEEVWRFAWLDSLMWDIRYALRGFRNSPGFALTVIGTLALGLGSVAVAFSEFNALVLRPFAVRDPYSLYGFTGWGSSKGQNTSIRRTLTWREFTDFRRENPAFSEVLGYQNGTAPMAGKWASIQAVTGNYFQVLGGRICMGRPLLEKDDESGEGVAVASHSAWKSRFASDPGIVGTKVRLGRQSVEIVGVACREFSAPQIERVDFWVSLALSRELANSDQQVDFPQLSIMGRLKPGLTRESAEEALLAYGRNQYLAWHNWQRPERAHVQQRATVIPLSGGAITGFMPIFLLFALVLLTACANVSNMMLARGLARRREIGIRISLGAGRARVIRQLLTESLLLALAASLAAFGVAYGFMRALFWMILNIFPSSYLREFGWHIDFASLLPDLRVLAFIVSTALITTLVFGLVPALQTTRSRLVQANRGEFEGGYRSARLRSALVIIQATFCALLLVLSATAVHNGMRIYSLDLGLDTVGVFSIETSDKYRQSVLERVSSLSNTISIGTYIKPPLDSWFGRIPFFHPKFVGEAGNVEVQCQTFPVSPEYFDVHKIAVRGRKLPLNPLNPMEFMKSGSQDGTDVVVSETAARRLWPSGDALGRPVEERRLDPKSGRTITYVHTVVGVAGDSITELYDYTGALNPNRTVVYLLAPPIEKHAYLNGMIVRMKGNPGAARLLLQKAIEETTPEEKHYQISSAQEEMDRILLGYRVLTTLEGFLGAMALLMTAFGVFGMQSYMVAQRKKEFGIRMALGADKARIIGMVLRQSLRLAAAGSVLGAFLALAVARVLAQSVRTPEMQAPLFNADSYAFDIGGYVAGVLVVIAAAMAASWIPARKAVNLDPARTLHCD